MMMNKEQMMDKVINRLGFENEWTIWFCNLAESTDDEDYLRKVYVFMEIV